MWVVNYILGRSHSSSKMGDLDLLLGVIRCKRDVKIPLLGLVKHSVLTNILRSHFKFGL